MACSPERLTLVSAGCSRSRGGHFNRDSSRITSNVPLATDEQERSQPPIGTEEAVESFDPVSGDQPIPEQGPDEPAAETTSSNTRARLPASYRRRALRALDRTRLQDLCDAFELDVQDRRANDSFIAALIRARRLDFTEVLGHLKREELQAVCVALDLFQGGREKSVLVDRILAGPEQANESTDDDPDGAEAPAYRLTPARKRAALGVLSRDRLAELTGHFDLEVHDLRAKADHIGAIIRKRSLPFAEVLQLLSRDELKSMCVELELDDGGREKRVIVERILGEPLPDSGEVLVERHAAAARVTGPDDPTAPMPAVPAAPAPVGDPAVPLEFPLVARAREAGVLDGKGALIVAPTATGKSTIGRLVIRRALERNRNGKCAYLVPYRALAWELYEVMHEELVAADPSLRVRIATGDATDPVDPSGADVIVGTYESFAALHATKAVDPAVLVVDEIHMLADESRGPPLEMLLSHFRGTEVQLCGLSAVIDDPDPLAEWLGVAVVRGTTDDRAVPVEFAVEQVADLDAELEARALEAVQRGDNVLVFCHSKAQAEAVARNLSKHTASSLGRSDKERLGQLKFFLDDPDTGNERLADLVPNGVAYHHAGLVRDVRRQIEDAYREGALKLIASTPTLAAGVNLPAQVVFLKGVHRSEMRRNQHRRVLLPASEVLNMLGRAGRPGQSTSGRGVVLIKRDVEKSDRAALEKALQRGTGDPVHSRMGDKFDWILRLALRETAERECTLGHLREALMRTLWYAEEGGAVEFHRKLRDDLMEDIPTFKRAEGLELLLDSVAVQPDGVTASVTSSSGDKAYDVSIRLESFTCSCPSRQRWHHGDVCKHLARAIHDLLFSGHVDEEARYRAMYACLDLFRTTLDLGTKLRDALRVLEHWQLVDATATGYRATPAGQVAAWSGLDLLLVVDAFRRILAAEGTPEPREVALWTIDDFFGNPADREKWRKALEPWLDEVRTADVPLPTEHRGIFERTRDNLVQVVRLYARVAQAFGKADLARSAETAAGCLRHGVRPDALPLAALNIPQLRRGRCRYLIEQHGIKTVDDLANAVPGYIADRRQFLSPETCEEWIKRAEAIRQRRAAVQSAPASEQPSAMDDLLAQFRVEPIALEKP